MRVCSHHQDTTSPIAILRTQTVSETAVSITSDARDGSYNIESLQEGTEYSITVSLWRDGAISDMDTVKHSTADAGELLFSPSFV